MAEITKDTHTIKRFLDDLLADLQDEDEVYLTIEEETRDDEPKESVWHGKIEDLFGRDLDVILEDLEPSARLYVNGRSGSLVFALAAPCDGVRATWRLQVPNPGRVVCVASLDPPGDAEAFFEYAVEIPVPGIGGVLVLDEGGPIDPDDDAIEPYLDALDKLFAEEEGTADDAKDAEDGDGDGDDTGDEPVEDDAAEAGLCGDRAPGSGDGHGQARRHDHGDAIGEVGDDGGDDDHGGGHGQAGRQDADPGRAHGRLEGDGNEHAHGVAVDDEAVEQDRPVPDDVRRQAEPAEGEPAGRSDEAAPGSRGREWLDGTVEGRCSKETMEREVIVGTHTSARRPNGWENIQGNLGQFAEMLMAHPENPSKDGHCILQGQILGDRRTKQAIRAMYFMALDLDTGETLAEIQDRVRKFDRMAFVYSTFSHLKTRDDFARADVVKFAEDVGKEIDTALLRKYLVSRKGFNKRIADSAELIDAAEHTEAGIRVTFKHAPCPKFRLFFPLKDPYIFVQRCGGDHRLAMEEWRAYLYSLSMQLELHFDAACTDPSRLFYSPRHGKGKTHESWCYLTDALLDVDADLVKVDPRQKDAFSAFAEKVRGRENMAEIENKWLFDWVKRYGRKFEADQWFQQYLPDYVIEHRPSGSGFTILCPHHQANSVHSREDPGGTFVAPADPDNDRGFVLKCTHEHCVEVDSLAQIDILLREGLVKPRDLFDPSFLMLDADEPIPVEWDETVKQDRLDEIVGLIERKEGDYNSNMVALAEMWSDLVPADQRAIRKRVAKATDAQPAEIAKEIRQIQRNLFSTEEDLASIEVPEINAETMRKYLGGDYAVLNANGKVGIVDMEASKKGLMSVSPSIMGKADFELFTANRKIPVDGANGPEMAPVSKMFFEWTKRPTFDALCFEPDPKRMPKNGFNCWRGFTMKGEARGKGDWSLFDDHIFDNVCCGDEEHYVWLMTWIADIFQNPATKRGSSVVLKGSKGTGKSFFCDVLKHVLIPYSFTITSQSTLVGDFNDHLFGRLLIVAEEAVWGGDKRHEGKLKSLITEGRMEMSKKHFTTVEVSNYSRFIFTSNEEWTIPTAFGRERRFLVLDVSDARQLDTDYFAAIDEQLRNGGYEAFVHDMMTLDPPPGKGWEILRQAPQTEGLNYQKAKSASPAQRFFIEMIESGKVEILNDGVPEAVVLSKDALNKIYWPAIREAYFEYVRRAGAQRDAEPSVFYRHAEEILMAKRGGKPGSCRDPIGTPMTGAEVAANRAGGSGLDGKVRDGIVFPGLERIVQAHAVAGRFEFNVRWLDDAPLDDDMDEAA